jgi:hypothetical protein
MWNILDLKIVGILDLSGKFEKYNGRNLVIKFSKKYSFLKSKT